MGFDFNWDHSYYYEEVAIGRLFHPTNDYQTVTKAYVI